ncbi:hypothetical protein NBRGN_041_00010 [Nocardia brasiliensis NBRC 14402]|uniref:hypothetical protein n=1 Tax=Nocardia brasiliensis TaxID=37326 RepID=UPI00031E11C7|nr:hypothetical protein [Nocardia brasiliensis]ASF09309.1 hypothetical protein CEQ30_20285 [Nocardia brasiliensis]GAJ81653.1 hypothetical protein NBRGN_041_00010 [Nocardia brasiliensis NBRC 14402]
MREKVIHAATAAVQAPAEAHRAPAPDSAVGQRHPAAAPTAVPECQVAWDHQARAPPDWDHKSQGYRVWDHMAADHTA